MTLDLLAPVLGHNGDYSRCVGACQTPGCTEPPGRLTLLRGALVGPRCQLAAEMEVARQVESGERRSARRTRCR